MTSDILIVDDEDDIRSLIQGILEDEGYKTREAASSEQAYAQVEKKLPGLIVLDIWLQGSADDGLDILKTLKQKYPDLPFVMISGHGTIETAVSAIKDGAYDFIEKPFKSDRLLMMINRALENARLRRENAVLKRRTLGKDNELTGSSPALQNVLQVIERAAPTNSRILIKGEAGTGKDIAARLIHKKSLRADEVFMTLNCATLRPERFEIELFGSEAGASGEGDYTGILEQAKGGTLILDEVADMPLETQGKIVRVLQEQQFQRIGGQALIELDVRVLATTNRDLEAAIEKGDFREDLYYRLNVVQIDMPALRERTEDIKELAGGFLQAMLKQSGFENKVLSEPAVKTLQNCRWPGNIRQLKNVIEWVCIMHGGGKDEMLGPEHLPPELSGNASSSMMSAVGQGFQDDLMSLSLRDAREAFEREYLLAQIDRFEGNISKTAQFVGMERSALHRKLKSLQINPDKDKTVAELSRKRA